MESFTCYFNPGIIIHCTRLILNSDYFAIDLNRIFLAQAHNLEVAFVEIVDNQGMLLGHLFVMLHVDIHLPLIFLVKWGDFSPDDHVGFLHVVVLIIGLQDGETRILELGRIPEFYVIVAEFVEPHLVYVDLESSVKLCLKLVVPGAFTGLNFIWEIFVEELIFVFQTFLNARILLQVLIADTARIDDVWTNPCHALTILVDLDHL
jgi:hypothetical protein